MINAFYEHIILQKLLTHNSHDMNFAGIVFFSLRRAA